MSRIAKKKKKSLLVKYIGKLMLYSSCEESISNDVSLGDIRIDDDVVNTIALRRNELKTAKNNNSGVTVSIEKFYKFLEE